MIPALLKDPKFLTDIFETMRDGLMVVDQEGTILLFNRAAEEITGYHREDVIGKPCTTLDTDSCMIVTDAGKRRSCDIFKKGSMFNKQCRIKSSTGNPIYLMKNAVVLKGSDGEIIGAVESLTNITSLYMKELEIQELKQELRDEGKFMDMLGKSTCMQKLYEQLRNAAKSEAPVLVCGESGTGKDLVASAIHALSRRKDGPYIKMNCAALNEYLLESELFGHKKGSFTGAINDRIGRFEAAHKGSFFLDEIGDMPLSMQAKLLRVIEEKVVERVGEHRPIPVNIRLISATNKDLHNLVVKGKFREDLFYRVNSIFIHVPALRERADDIPAIVSHYLKKISHINNKEIRRISPHALEVITNFNWPGNVRQLISALEHSAITCRHGAIEVSDLPDYVFCDKKTERAESCIDRERIRTVLSMFKGNKSLAAKHLGISRVTLWKRLKEFGEELPGK